jgi:hypothetical protein
MTPSRTDACHRPAPRARLRRLTLCLLACAVSTGTAAVSATALGATRVAARPVSHWKGTQAPLPATAAADPGIGVRQLTCAAVGACVAVASFSNKSLIRSGVIEQLRGGSWRATAAPVPRGSSATADVTLTSVSCPNSRSCGVSGYLDTPATRRPELLSLRRGSWTALAAPLVRGTIADSSTSLSSISCPRPGSCVAVGRYQGAHGYFQGLIDVQSGRRWRAVKAPVPADTARNPFGGVDWVSCPRAGRCITVGAYVDRRGRRELFADVLAGGTWRSSRLPLPAHPARNPIAFLGYVTCRSPVGCLAVGNFVTSSGATEGLFEREISGVWHATRAPVPRRAPANPLATINEASCPTISFCAATGDYQDRAGDGQGLLETFSKGSWSAVSAPAPAGDRTDRFMSTVSCPIARWCVAGGSTDISALLETYARGHWKVTVAPLPAPGLHALFQSTSVSCPSTQMCAAFGAFTKDHGTMPQGQGFLETYRAR